MAKANGFFCLGYSRFLASKRSLFSCFKDYRNASPGTNSDGFARAGESVRICSWRSVSVIFETAEKASFRGQESRVAKAEKSICFSHTCVEERENPLRISSDDSPNLAVKPGTGVS